MSYKIIPALAFPFILAACAVGPDYEKPETKTLQSWKKPAEYENLKISTEANAVKVNWWENFSDPTLNELISEAEKSNGDLKIAEGRLREARAGRLQALSPLFPDISGSISTTRGNHALGSQQRITESYEAGLDATWEIDIFGGQRRRYEASKDLAQAAAADLDSVLISLRAEVAANYIEYRNLQNQIDITINAVNSLQDTAKLTRQQFEFGIISSTDLADVESDLSNIRARLPELQTSLERARNNLTTLLGRTPGELDEKLDEKKSVPVADRQFLLTTPADAIASRPDIRFAERSLAAATELQGAAFANQFPQLSLGAFFGIQDSSMINRSRLWSLAGDILVPIFSVGTVRSQIRIADARQEQALATYEQSVIAALGEIQTNIVTYINKEAKRESMLEYETNSKNTVKLTYERYKLGDVSLLDVFVFERNYYEAQSQLVAAQAEVAESLITLNKSLGR